MGIVSGPKSETLLPGGISWTYIVFKPDVLGVIICLFDEIYPQQSKVMVICLTDSHNQKLSNFTVVN